MNVLLTSAACLLVSTAVHAAGGVRTVDAEDIPITDLTRVAERVGPSAPTYCHPANGRRGEPRRFLVRFDIEADGTTSNARVVDRPGPLADCAGAAERAVRQWTFVPPMHEGESVRITNAVTTIGYEPRRRWNAAFN